MGLYEKARLLSEEEAGGHGDVWDLFDKGVDDFLVRRLPILLKHADPLPDPQTSPTRGKLLRYRENNDIGIIAAVEITDEDRMLLSSLYPEFRGIEHQAQIEEIELFPNRLEARVVISLPNILKEITFFDTRFLIAGRQYEEDSRYTVELAALAIYVEKAKSDPIVIDDPEEIEKYRARMHWLQTHDRYTQEEEAQALELYRREVDGPLEPVVLQTNQMSIWLDERGREDLVLFQGEIVKILPNETEIFGNRFKCFHIAIHFFPDDDLILPLYIHTKLISEDKSFQCGDYIFGDAWIHGHVVAKHPKEP